MESDFDYIRFEKLKGLDLGLFACSQEARLGLNEKFIDYFRIHRQKFDIEHLQAALVLLCELLLLEIERKKDIYYELVEYIDHPSPEIRFPAIKALSNNENYDEIDSLVTNDEFIIKKVKQIIKDNNGDLLFIGMHGLKAIAEKATNKD